MACENLRNDWANADAELTQAVANQQRAADEAAAANAALEAATAAVDATAQAADNAYSAYVDCMTGGPVVDPRVASSLGDRCR